MTLEERHKQVEGYLGKTVSIEIDRPIGYVHRKGEKTLVYPINYGFIPGVLGGDGEELDVFLVEDKLVMAPAEGSFTAEEIARTVYFQEKYYDTTARDIFGARVHISRVNEK